MTITRSFRRIALAALLSFGLSACYGSFTAVRAVHRWNGSVGPKIVNTLVFWGLIIIPVYELVSLGDAIIFNLIEFWTDRNPLAENDSRPPTLLADGSVELQIGSQTYSVRKEGDDTVVLSRGERVLAVAVSMPDGSAEIQSLEDPRTVRIDQGALAELATWAQSGVSAL